MQPHEQFATPRMLFINPCIRPDARIKFPPVGLACILTALEKANYAFDLIDMDIDYISDQQLAKALRNKKYDLVGLGCIVSSLALVCRITKLIREELPDALILVGNSVATSIPDMLLTRTDANIACIGEGDITAVEIADALRLKKDWRCVPGIAFVDNTGKVQFSPKRPVVPDLDSLGFPDWHLFEINKYNHGMMTCEGGKETFSILFPLNSARGCIYNCTFCYHCFKGEKYRSFSESAIMQEYTRLKNDFNATHIALWDELSFPTVKKFEERIANLEKLPFVVKWDGITRANLFKKEDLPILRRAKSCGLQNISFSIENASPEILKAMNKKISHEKTEEHALTLWKAGICPRTSIIFGYPQETKQTIRMTLELCERCNIYPSVGFLQPLPGTPIYRDACASGKIPDEWEYLMNAGDRQDMHVNLTSMPTEELVAFVHDELAALARRLGIHVDNPLKTTDYRVPKKRNAASI